MIKNYITGVQPDHKYLLKFVGYDKAYTQELIEAFFAEYKVLDLKVSETAVQLHPDEFPGFTNMPVCIAKLTTALAVSPDYAKQLFCREFRIPESMVIFRSENSPLETQKNLDLLRGKLREKGALLDVTPEYKKEEQGEAGENFFGNLYNNKLLQVMAEIKKKQESEREIHIDAKSPLFTWLQHDATPEQEPVQDKTNMNAPVEAGVVADTLNSGATKHRGI